MPNPFDIPSTPTSSTPTSVSDMAAPVVAASKQTKKLIGIVLMIATVGMFGVILVIKALPQQTDGRVAVAKQAEYSGWEVGTGEAGELKKSMGQLDADRAAWIAQNQKVITKLDDVTTSQHDLGRRLSRLEQQSGELVSRNIVTEVASADSRAVPESLRDLHSPAAEFLSKIAADQGTYGWDAAGPYLIEWVKQQNKVVNDNDVKALYEAAQVQREPLSDSLLDAIPSLVRKRVAMRLASNNMSGIAKMVWAERETIPAFTPGQLVSMASMVARSSNGAAANTQLDEVVASGPDRQISLGFQTIAQSDLPAITAAALPYVQGELSTATQDAARIAFLTTRARVIARGFVQRDTPLARTLVAAAKEELSRFDRYKVPSVTVQGDEIDAATRVFMAEVSGGLAIGRAQREGVVDPERITHWANDIAAGIPKSVARGIDLRQIQASYGVLTVRDPQVPTVPPVVADAIDQALGPAIGKQREQIIEKDRPAFVSAAAIHGVTAALMAGRSSTEPTKDQVASAVTRAVQMVAVAFKSVDRVMDEVDRTILPAYGTLFERAQNRDWLNFAQEARIQAERTVYASLMDAPSGAPKPELVDQVSGSATRQLEAWIAQTAALDMCNAEIDRAATTAALPLVKQARTYAEGRIRRQIVPPLSRDRVVQLTYVIAREALAVLNGRKRVLDTSNQGSPAQAPSSGYRPSSSLPTGSDTSATSRSDTPRSATSQGMQFLLPVSDAKLVNRRSVIIPAGTYGEARTLTGVVCELGDKTPREILLNLQYSWKGPNDHFYVMRNMRLIGLCVAMGGAPRVYCTLDKASLELPDHRKLTIPASGWVVEQGKGTSGVLGEWDMQLFDKVIPLAGTTGLFEAIAAALKPNSSVQVNVSQATTVTQSDADSPLKKGTSGGAGEAAAQAANFTNRVLSQINPYITVQNNQNVCVVLRNDLQMDIPVEDWDATVEEHTLSSSGGFSH